MSDIPVLHHNQAYGLFTLPDTDTDTDKWKFTSVRCKHFQTLSQNPIPLVGESASA